MLFLTLAELITLAIAIWGAGLSTLAIVLRYLDRRIRIKVVVYGTQISFALNTPTEHAVMIKASNVGGRKTSLENFTLLLTKEHKEISLDPHIYKRERKTAPYEFAPGNPDLKIPIASKYLARDLKKYGYSGVVPFKVFFTGVAGKKYESKEMWFDTEKLDVLDKPPKSHK